MIETTYLDNKYLKPIFQNIQDGIIIMDQNRKILAMNPSAERLTGWQLDGSVPFCSFCEKRNLKTGEHRCYLIENDEIPYFLSKMPTYHGSKIDVEMSTALMYQDSKSNQKEYLLVLRDHSAQKKAEEARISKLIIKQLIDAKESEHKRLAQELHDGVGQSLYTISVALQAIESYINDERLNTYIAEVRDELEKVMGDIQSYSYQLRPKSLDQLGLVATIHSLVETYEKNHLPIAITFETNLKERAPGNVEINLYRVIQEALHNISKYSKAERAYVKLFEKAGALFLNIEDDGVGFDPQNIKNEGLGLKHMRERIDQLGGNFELASSPGKGTKIKIVLPDWKEVSL